MRIYRRGVGRRGCSLTSRQWSGALGRRVTTRLVGRRVTTHASLGSRLTTHASRQSHQPVHVSLVVLSSTNTYSVMEWRASSCLCVYASSFRMASVYFFTFHVCRNNYRQSSSSSNSRDRGSQGVVGVLIGRLVLLSALNL